jgi:hypothetical protein
MSVGRTLAPPAIQFCRRFSRRQPCLPSSPGLAPRSALPSRPDMVRPVAHLLTVKQKISSSVTALHAQVSNRATQGRLYHASSRIHRWKHDIGHNLSDAFYDATYAHKTVSTGNASKLALNPGPPQTAAAFKAVDHTSGIP